MSLVRWGSGQVGFGAIVLAALVGSTLLHAGCKDTLEPGVPVDASDTDDVDTIHEDAEPPAIPSTEAGGEPPRRDSGAPADASPPPADAGPG